MENAILNRRETEVCQGVDLMAYKLETVFMNYCSTFWLSVIPELKENTFMERTILFQIKYFTFLLLERA